jgi:hypothetical protein
MPAGVYSMHNRCVQGYTLPYAHIAVASYLHRVVASLLVFLNGYPKTSNVERVEV